MGPMKSKIGIVRPSFFCWRGGGTICSQNIIFFRIKLKKKKERWRERIGLDWGFFLLFFSSFGGVGGKGRRRDRDGGFGWVL